MKYFVCSDPHGFTTIMKECLHEKGFDENNPEHTLIINGDIFDRGDEPVEMYQYLKSLGDRFIFIRGNHENLLFDAMGEFMRCGDVYSYHHIHNGTDKTIYKLYNEGLLGEVVGWIKEKSINFAEIGDYIFVHGWIPCGVYDEWGYTLGYEYNENWRECDDGDWYNAQWLNGMRMWHMGIKEPNKTIICGHWHCGFGNQTYHEEVIEHEDSEWMYTEDEYYLSDHPFIDDGIMALDTCVPLTKKVNVVVLEV